MMMEQVQCEHTLSYSHKKVDARASLKQPNKKTQNHETEFKHEMI